MDGQKTFFRNDVKKRAVPRNVEINGEMGKKNLFKNELIKTLFSSKS